MTEEEQSIPWTPSAVAQEMQKTIARLEKSASIVKGAHEKYLAAKRAWTVAKAEKRQENTGSRDDRDDKATISTMDLYKEMDTASVAHKYASDLAGILEKKLSALQTQAKLIMLEYNTSGRT